MVREQGVALIQVLLLVAVISMLAMPLTEHVQQAGQRVSSRLETAQLDQYVEGGRALGELKLARLLARSPARLPHFLQQPPLEYPVAGGGIGVEIRSRHNCLNLNSLSSERTLESFPDYWWALGEALSLDRQAYLAFTARLLGLLNKGPAGGHQTFISMTELAAVWPADSDASWRTLRRLLCVRGGDRRLSIDPNALRSDQVPLVQALLGNRLSADQVLRLIESRPPAGYVSLDTFFAHPVLRDLLLDADKTLFTLESRYFQIHVFAKTGELLRERWTQVRWMQGQLHRQSGSMERLP